MIKIIKEPGGMEGLERCCFCRDRTPYWTKKDVAICLSCAKIHVESEVPSKREWCDKEAKLSKRAWES